MHAKFVLECLEVFKRFEMIYIHRQSELPLDNPAFCLGNAVSADTATALPSHRERQICGELYLDSADMRFLMKSE